jgi:hypothetical protein
MTQSIHNTALVPYLIAQQVAGNDEAAVTYLEKRAERHYENSWQFRLALNNPHKDSREVLASFMRHWLQAYQKYNGLKQAA